MKNANKKRPTEAELDDVMFSEATGLGDSTAQGEPPKKPAKKPDVCCD